MLQEEQQSATAALRTTACPTNTMDVIIGIIWGVKLDNPVNFREVKTSLSNVSAEKNALFCLTEFKVS